MIKDWERILEQLEGENCKAIELVFIKEIQVNKLKNILDKISNTIINSINLTFPYQEHFKEETIIELYQSYPAIHFMSLYLAPFDKQVYLDDFGIRPIHYCKNKIDLSKGGAISTENFVVNQLFFSESLNFNTYHNRKIAIDVSGNIKNCPATKRSYGNIRNSTLKDAIAKDGFKEYWFIKKDDIDVCQDCEFRHLCSDSRSFITDPSDVFSQPLKCGYNPYIGLWEGQDKWQSILQWREDNPNWEEKAFINRRNITYS